ncbi:MAG: AraC family transcriptional regulator [Lachnospiraceae bacterium]|nr:AraC family transcriptional regulator [Lachnospiraceae bacterium]
MARSQLYYFTSVGRFFCESSYSVDREDYGNYLLAYVERGTLLVKTKGQRFGVHQGEVAFIDCHTPHSYWPLDAVDFTWLHFEGQNTAALHKMITAIHESPVFRVNDPQQFLKKMKNVVFQIKYNPVNNEYRDSMEIYSFLITMLTEHVVNLSKHESGRITETVINDAIHYIEEHLQDDLTVSMIAGHVGLSESHFSRKFRAAVNTSPKDYLIRRRLTRAKLLLKTTELPIKEIAFQVGFNSESHFTNSFSGMNGISPREFRKLKI